MTDGNNEKPQTDAQASRALAQQLTRGARAPRHRRPPDRALLQPQAPTLRTWREDRLDRRRHAARGRRFRVPHLRYRRARAASDLQGGQRQVLGLRPRGQGAAHHTDRGQQRELHGAGQGPFRPDRGSMQRGRSARSWRCHRAPGQCHQPWGARRAIRTIRPRSRHKRASAAYGAAPSRGRQTGAWPIHARTNRPRRSLRRLRFGLS